MGSPSTLPQLSPLRLARPGAGRDWPSAEMPCFGDELRRLPGSFVGFCVSADAGLDSKVVGRQTTMPSRPYFVRCDGRPLTMMSQSRWQATSSWTAVIRPSLLYRPSISPCHLSSLHGSDTERSMHSSRDFLQVPQPDPPRLLETQDIARPVQ